MQPIFKNLTSEELVSFGSQPGKQLELAQKQLEVAKKYSSMDFNDVRISAHLNGIPLPILGFEELMRMTREKYKDQSNEAKRQLEADSRSKLILSASSEFSKYLFNNATQIKEILNSARYSKMSFSDARRGVPERVDIQGIGCAASGFGCAIGAASLPILAALPGVGWVSFGFTAFTTALSCFSLIGCQG